MANNSPKQKHYQHEGTDVSGRSFVWVASILVVILVFIGFILLGLLAYFDGRRSDSFGLFQREAEEKRAPSLPHLQAKSGVSMKKLQQEKESLLHSYGWVNKEKGVVHIPIERAMELFVKRELPMDREKPSRQQ